MSFCGIDIGSNTFSYTELNLRDGGIEISKDASLAVRLSQNLKNGGELSATAIERGLNALCEIAVDLDLGGKPLRAVGTAALRMASNPEAFTVPAEEIIGAEIEIIPGEEEARLAARGAAVGLDIKDRLLTIDIGGQSTELCWQVADGSLASMSLSLGVIDLTERHLRTDPPTDAELKKLRTEVRGVIDTSVNRNLEGTVVGVAGTATTIAWLDLGLETWDRRRVHGLELGGDRVEHWLRVMRSVSSLDRQKKYGIRPVRADVFPAGLVIMDEMLKHLGRESFVVSANGLRIGVAMSLIGFSSG